MGNLDATIEFSQNVFEIASNASRSSNIILNSMSSFPHRTDTHAWPAIYYYNVPLFIM